MQVYLSHSGKDRDLARRLTTELENAGILTWNPDDHILPGDNWAEEIGKALESSEVMVALFSQGGTDNEDLRRDVQFAMTSGNYRGRVVPVLHGFTTFTAGADIPWIVLHLDPIYVDASARDLTPIVQRIQSLTGVGCNAAD